MKKVIKTPSGVYFDLGALVLIDPRDSRCVRHKLNGYAYFTEEFDSKEAAEHYVDELIELWLNGKDDSIETAKEALG